MQAPARPLAANHVVIHTPSWHTTLMCQAATQWTSAVPAALPCSLFHALKVPVARAQYTGSTCTGAPLHATLCGRAAVKVWVHLPPVSHCRHWLLCAVAPHQAE